jgi:hypothetical protein
MGEKQKKKIEKEMMRRERSVPTVSYPVTHYTTLKEKSNHSAE